MSTPAPPYDPTRRISCLTAYYSSSPSSPRAQVDPPPTVTAPCIFPVQLILLLHIFMIRGMYARYVRYPRDQADVGVPAPRRYRCIWVQRYCISSSSIFPLLSKGLILQLLLLLSELCQGCSCSNVGIVIFIFFVLSYFVLVATVVPFLVVSVSAILIVVIVVVIILIFYPLVFYTPTVSVADIVSIVYVFSTEL